MSCIVCVPPPPLLAKRLALLGVAQAVSQPEPAPCLTLKSEKPQECNSFCYYPSPLPRCLIACPRKQQRGKAACSSLSLSFSVRHTLVLMFSLTQTHTQILSGFSCPFPFSFLSARTDTAHKLTHTGPDSAKNHTRCNLFFLPRPSDM